MISISTMGCNDFYDFLFSYFVELGIQMMERAYIIQIEEEVINFLEGTYERVAKILTKLMDGDENEQQTEEEKLEGRKENLNNNNESNEDVVVDADKTSGFG
jgi:hypothetical protein